MMGLRTLKPSDGFSDLAPGLELLPMIGGRVDRRAVSRDATTSPGQARSAGSNTKVVLSNSGPEGTIFYDVHIFYYIWYGTPQMDGKYIHWDHILVPHWDPKIASSYPRGRHMPPEDIGSSFYPELNPYSSRDPDVLESHMEQIGASAAGTVQSSTRNFLGERRAECCGISPPSCSALERNSGLYNRHATACLLLRLRGSKHFQHHTSIGQLPTWSTQSPHISAAALSPSAQTQTSWLWKPGVSRDQLSGQNYDRLKTLECVFTLPKSLPPRARS